MTTNDDEALVVAVVDAVVEAVDAVETVVPDEVAAAVVPAAVDATVVCAELISWREFIKKIALKNFNFNTLTY